MLVMVILPGAAPAALTGLSFVPPSTPGKSVRMNSRFRKYEENLVPLLPQEESAEAAPAGCVQP